MIKQQHNEEKLFLTRRLVDPVSSRLILIHPFNLVPSRIAVAPDDRHRLTFVGFRLRYDALVGSPGLDRGRSSAPRSQPPSVDAVSYVLSRNWVSMCSGDGDSRTASYGRIHSRMPRS